MIELVSSALVDWFSSLETSTGQTIEVALASPGAVPERDPHDARPDEPRKGVKGRPPARAQLALRLVTIRECNNRRTHDVDETRDANGRVVARHKATRYFDVDYAVTADGDPLASHASIGAIIQALVDNDLIPSAFLPDDLDITDLEVTITPDEARSPTDRACLSIRAMVAVRPTEQTDIAPPAESLHLDVGPPPSAPTKPTNGATPGSGTGPGDLAERRWTTVRRRESIAPGGE